MLGFPAVAEFAGTERPEDWGSIYLGDTFMQVRGDQINMVIRLVSFADSHRA